MADLRVKVGLDNSAFQTGLAAMENSVQRFGMKAGGLLAGAFTVDKILGGFMGAIDKGDQLQDLANRFGVAASAIQEIGNAASLSGAGIEDVASAMNKLARNAGEAIGGNEKMQEAFAKIGLTVADLNGMSPQDLFMALSRAVASGALGMQDFAVAQELAGRGAASLMETLRMGPEAIAATGQAMGVFGDETTAALSKASDAIKTVQQQFTMAFGAIAAAAVPLIETFQTAVESVTLLGLAAKSAITGDFGAAAQQLKAAQMVDVDKQMEKRRNAEAQTVRNVDGEGPAAAADRKLSETAARDEAKFELRLIEARIDGRREAEKILEDFEQKAAEDEKRKAERRVQELDDARQRIEEAEQEQRQERLAKENRRRGNETDFDPREAMIERLNLSRPRDMASTFADMARATEMKQGQTQSVTLSGQVPQLDEVLSKLGTLIDKAGSFGE
jgi:hypothetical protein